MFPEIPFLDASIITLVAGKLSFTGMNHYMLQVFVFLRDAQAAEFASVRLMCVFPWFFHSELKVQVNRFENVNFGGMDFESKVMADSLELRNLRQA